jgi:lysozyme
VTYRDIAKAQLKVDEGVRVKPYRDSLGILSIGVGRNLEDRGLRPSEVDFMLDNDLDEAEATARRSSRRSTASRKHAKPSC